MKYPVPSWCAPEFLIHTNQFSGRAGKDKSSQSLFETTQERGLPTQFLDEAKEVIAPGATIIFTDKPVDPTTQSPTGFQVLVTQKDKASGTIE
jgi:hypothetical protein